jgi:hypothetical protein
MGIPIKMRELSDIPSDIPIAYFKLEQHQLESEKKNVSIHSLRKSGARIILELHNKSDESLIKLSFVLNHSSTTITRRYLGITKEEIADIYEGFDFKL